MIGSAFPDTLAAARAGDRDAFSDLYRDVNPPLVRYLRTLVRDYADDAASETWIGVVKGLPSFEGTEASFRAWVFTIARNKVVDWRRRMSIRAADHLDPDNEVGLPHAPDAADVAEESFSTRRAVALIATLPEDQAEAVLLRVLGGLDVADVAQMMGRSPGAVRVLCHRGLKRLAGSMTPPTIEEV